ncbi:HlyD family efflux transporter periplasmic adaptor subunit [Flavobacterium sp. HXWNR29]|uniref:HlyD family secretion protein n=1 Tax=Flavobacterium odoriferum TaxID=2946604 RepID=UPI0021CB7A5A|nr:HlyD family efflux transporter periplasmic adaptor subunit [Flavobacterium sp. HXWNR29]MCU4189936.1 HlyD family efflux transporter periplasmic adaptor subunit [Flavobacterium sp. HXWNR29]
MKKIILYITVLAIFSCNKDKNEADAFGNFEATEITISSEANGKIEFLKLEEGDLLQENALVGQIDTTQLYLNKQQLLASKNTIYSKSTNVLSQRNVLNEQLKTTLIEQKRIQNMFAESAATKRQVDEVNGKVSVLKQQMQSVETQNAPIINEVKSIDVQIEKINDQLKKSKIFNPISGTVLAKYAEPNEITAFGKPLYKMANLNEMTLRVYFSETQLASIKVGQDVNVTIDDKDGTKPYKGKISWISSSAEFTPKIIQTKEERVNLVYAVKIIVKNDGALKIGMPAEVSIN